MFLGIDDGTGSFMKKLLDPPRQASLDAAALSLEKLGAVTRPSDLSCGYVMTPLGTHLAAIPSPPIVGKRTWLVCCCSKQQYLTPSAQLS
jgi:HrpA-like RNA helicase